MKNKIENQRFSVWKLNRISNKGISPLIATVLIIGFTIVLSALVITWGTGLFKKTVSSTEELSEFNLLCTTGINFEGTAQYKDGGQIIETLLSNRNEKEIYGFHFTVRDKENTLPTKNFVTDPAIAPGTEEVIAPAIGSRNLPAFSTKTYEVGLGNGGYELIDVRPIVQLESGAKRVCGDNPQAVNVKNAAPA
ncbi:hypothetical protein J4440_01005 [Candidatus Woesearchaeota archaeon]|nr:hypothetical protein [Candidatus Woesearchaeota archaeon]